MAIIRKGTLCINRNAMIRISSNKRNRGYKTVRRVIINRNSFLAKELAKEKGTSSDKKKNRILVYIR